MKSPVSNCMTLIWHKLLKMSIHIFAELQTQYNDVYMRDMYDSGDKISE